MGQVNQLLNIPLRLIKFNAERVRIQTAVMRNVLLSGHRTLAMMQRLKSLRILDTKRRKDSRIWLHSLSKSKTNNDHSIIFCIDRDHRMVNIHTQIFVDLLN